MNKLVPTEAIEAMGFELGHPLLSWLPCPPWLGPPLPRFLQIYWPWAQIAQGPGKVDSYFTGNFEFHSGRESTQPMEEELELVRDESGALKKLIKRRSAVGGR